MTERKPFISEEQVLERLGQRHAAEKRFRFLCKLAVGIALAFLVLLFGDILYKGHKAFVQGHVRLPIHFDESVIDPRGMREREDLRGAGYLGLVRDALRERFPVEDRQERRELYSLVSSGAPFTLRDQVVEDPSLIGTTRDVWVATDDDVDMMLKGYLSLDLPEDQRRLSDRQLAWLGELDEAGDLGLRFNTAFFTQADSREPEMAGIAGAAMGSIYAMLITLALAFPLGVATAVYLEEFAPKNRWTDLIEVNINNLAAVPSIVFGLLGLAVLLFRSSPFGAAGGRVGADLDDPAHHHHRRPCGTPVGAAVDPSSGLRARGYAHAGRGAPRATPRPARHAHRHDHRHVPRPGRPPCS